MPWGVTWYFLDIEINMRKVRIIPIFKRYVCRGATISNPRRALKFNLGSVSAAASLIPMLIFASGNAVLMPETPAIWSGWACVRQIASTAKFFFER